MSAPLNPSPFPNLPSKPGDRQAQENGSRSPRLPFNLNVDSVHHALEQRGLEQAVEVVV